MTARETAYGLGSCAAVAKFGAEVKTQSMVKLAPPQLNVGWKEQATPPSPLKKPTA